MSFNKRPSHVGLTRIVPCAWAILALSIAAVLPGCVGAPSTDSAPGAGTAATVLPAEVSRNRDTERVLYSFGSGAAQNDGAIPYGPLVVDANEVVYGTTFNGGNGNGGTAFKLTPTASGYSEQVLLRFQPGPFGNGAHPYSGLTMDDSGMLYGATSSPSVTYSLGPSGTGYTETLLRTFQYTNGDHPYASLTLGKSHALFGTAVDGGNGTCNCGVVFKLSKAGLFAIHSFTRRDGAYPYAGITLDDSGTIYGATSAGGRHDAGVIFQLKRHGQSYTESVIYDFRGDNDGKTPRGSVVLDSTGTLYGTTAYGGSNGKGTVFKLRPSASGYSETVLYSFKGGNDGKYPFSGVTLGENGRIFGTTTSGGRNYGTVFQLTPKGSNYEEAVLHSFTGSDGASPQASLTTSNQGVLLGTTTTGGLHDVGTVFEVRP